MKLVLQSFFLLCFLLLSGVSPLRAHGHDGVGRRAPESVSAFGKSGAPQFSQVHAFIFPPPSILEETNIIAILDDTEEREEEDEFHSDGESVVSISYAATCARPRAPGGDCSLCANQRTTFCKHFAWSSQMGFIVLRAFRV